jgi:hypothetical protein
MAQQRGNDTTNIILILMAAGAVFVVIMMLVFIGAILINQTPGQSGGSDVEPYNLRARPIPKNEKLGDLLPTQLGKFKRTALKGSIQDFSATYVSDTGKVEISGAQSVSMRAAQVTVADLANAAGRQGGSQRLNSDPSYFLALPEKAEPRLLWSHSQWIFDVKASSKAALDEFMTAFKY